jgi:hypothetical protein
MPPKYLKKIHPGPSTVVAMFNNGAENYGKDEMDLIADINAGHEDDHEKTCRQALQDLQKYKRENNIEIDYPNFFERT